MHEKYHLPGFAYGVDGMFAKFDEKIRRIPVGPGFPNAQAFFTRKGFYGMTVLIVGDHRYLIRGMDADWPGGAHDAVVWSFSLVKVLVEENREHLLAGDSAFPISDVLVKPYSNQDALDDPRKRLFNLRHSGLRTEMTENIYAMLKRRWHILKHMREDYSQAKRPFGPLQSYTTCSLVLMMTCLLSVTMRMMMAVTTTMEETGRLLLSPTPLSRTQPPGKTQIVILTLFINYITCCSLYKFKTLLLSFTKGLSSVSADKTGVTPCATRCPQPQPARGDVFSAGKYALTMYLDYCFFSFLVKCCITKIKK